MASNRSCQLGRWPTALLESHYVKAHNADWMAGGCCASRNVQHSPPDAETTLRPNSLHLLFVVVADSRNMTRALAVANMAAVSQLREATSHWLVLAHDSDSCAAWADVEATTALLQVPFECHTMPRLQPLKAGDDPFRPKLPLQLHALRALRRSGIDAFDALWMPDADVAFTTDGVSAFLARWACAFDAGPPLVSQPAMHGDVGRTARAQIYWHLNYAREWQPQGRVAAVGALATHVAYVEQQAPLLDRRFFSWFADTVGDSLAAMQLSAGSDLSTDQLWCKAAGHYAQQVGVLQPSCAVIPIPFRHRDRVTIKQNARFWRGSHSVRVAAAQRWPQYWLDPKLLGLYKLSSYHIDKALANDRCMVERFSSRRLGPGCHREAGAPHAHAAAKADRSRAGRVGARPKRP